MINGASLSLSSTPPQTQQLREMDDPPPDHYVCPITRECMWEPMVVTHKAYTYRFDRVSLDAHLKTAYADRNPLTNVDEFLEPGRNAVVDTALRDEIRASRWAPEPTKPIELQEEASRGGLLGIELSFSLAWAGMWPLYQEPDREIEENELFSIVLYF